MAATPHDLATTDIRLYLREQREMDMLRFLTCGSVDDGKSTLIGRLLYEAKSLFEDQLAALEADSRRLGTQGGDLDFALLVDGLSAEREQGITIDVAYRFFATGRRKFIVADTPGHEQYTRNMVTGASTADLAILLVDARQGVLTQTRRHAYLVSLLGIREVVLAVNKMDLVGFAQARFDEIVETFRTFAAPLGLARITAIPLSALRGDNVTTRSAATPWYAGPALLEHLETVDVRRDDADAAPLRFPVQWVNRPNQDFRGFAGTLVSGRLSAGDRVRVQPSGRESTVRRIVTAAGDLPAARAGQAVTLVLADEVDVSRGDVLSLADAPAEVADQFETTIVWMHDEPLLPGRPYLLKLGTRTVNATVTDIKYKVNVNTLEHLAAKSLGLNEIGVCNVSLDRAVPFDPYTANRDTGGFILVDRIENHTLAAGLIHFALRRAHNIHVQAVDVDKAARAAAKAQKPGRPGREHPARGGGREADGRCRAHRHHGLHLAVPRGAQTRAEPARRGRVHRGVRGRPAGSGRVPRPQGSLPEGAPRRTGQLHGHRFPLRSAGAAGDRGAHGRRAGRGDARVSRRAPPGPRRVVKPRAIRPCA